MEEFETTTGGANTESEAERTFSGQLMPDSFAGIIRRLILTVFMGPGVFVTLWLFGRIFKR